MKINQTLKQAGQSLIALHGRFSKQKQWKAWTTLSTLAVAIALIATFGQNGTREREGTLKAPVTIPIVMEGKQVGSTKLAPGSSVSILEEQGDRVLIKTRSGETWVASDQVEWEPVPVEENVQKTVMQSGETHETEKTIENPRTTGSISKTDIQEVRPHKVLIWGIYMVRADTITKEILEESGITIVTKSPEGWMRPGVGEKKQNVPKLEAKDLEEEAGEYTAVWIANHEATPESAAAIRKMMQNKTLLIISGLSEKGVAALAWGRTEEAKRDYEHATRGKRQTKFGKENEVLFMMGGSPMAPCPTAHYREELKKKVAAEEEITKDLPKEERDKRIRKVYSDAAVALNKDAPIPNEEGLKKFIMEEVLPAIKP
jgi:hypothetical protein